MRLFVFILFLLPIALFAQDPTVGVLQYEATASEGYSLFAPSSYTDAFLIDNCGREINRWTSEFRATATYLTKEGDLYRCAAVPNDFASGGSSGRIERFDWEGNMTWSHTFSSDSIQLHHDIELLENGNILINLWERHSYADAFANGRDTALLTQKGLWSEIIQEITPIGTDDYTVVWHWDVWDHLVQDLHPSKPNYGAVADNPQLFNLNYAEANQLLFFDWMHFNSIDYNPALDQIMLSARHWSEVFIIDHSTTTQEAAGHTGGNSGKGGDILYRWGNPQTYHQGDTSDQRLFGQHDAQWILEGLPNEGKVIVYNNGRTRPEGQFSSIDIFTPPTLNGEYLLEANEAFGPDFASWTYDQNAPFDFFFSATTSGVFPLPNGNYLVCVGREGRFFEVENGTNEIVWEYKNPVRPTGPVSQGDFVAGNSVFKVEKYPFDFEGFGGKDLTPGNVLELNPWTNDCIVFTDAEDLAPADLNIYPNPASDFVKIKGLESDAIESVVLYDILGRLVFADFNFYGNELSVEQFPTGLYFLEINGIIGGKIQKK